MRDEWFTILNDEDLKIFIQPTKRDYCSPIIPKVEKASVSSLF